MDHWGIEIRSGRIPPWPLQPGSAGGVIALLTPRLGRDTEAPFVVVFELRKHRGRGALGGLPGQPPGHLPASTGAPGAEQLQLSCAAASQQPFLFRLFTFSREMDEIKLGEWTASR
ncbi:hypothetical protein J1605_004342 [Eschrichtius robustus]|uniref:Uncharacterized protein n=1 Tax=Eschrichtius robustus TaxID=9764 RepID=A0AB34HKG3_ESCRO|nr:hypothetical protein J1605_004342 [Eschrichtius robustus]